MGEEEVVMQRYGYGQTFVYLADFIWLEKDAVCQTFFLLFSVS